MRSVESGHERIGLKSILIIALLFASLIADDTQYEVGKDLYFEKGCNGCHGLKAEGMNEYPGLANRAKGFLTYKLQRFRSGVSDNQQQEMMLAFARSLSDEEIDALTTYLNEYHDEDTERYDSSFQTWGDGGS